MYVGQCLLALIAVYILLAVIPACRRLRWRYLASVWNCVDLLVVGLTWLSIFLFVVLMVHDANVQSTFTDDHSSYISYAQSAECHHVWRCVNALLLLMLLIVVRNLGGDAAAWAGWAMAHPKFWLGGPQCIWPTNSWPVCLLILRKYSKIGATRCQLDVKVKMHQIWFPLELRLRPHRGSLQCSPNPLAVFKGPTSKGREGRKGEGKER